MRPDLLVEIDGGLIITSYTDAGEHFMRELYGQGTPAQRTVLWTLPTAVLDPFIYGATRRGLTLLVRKAKT